MDTSYVVSDFPGSREGDCHPVERVAERTSLSLGVAASSAFPAFFHPLSTRELGFAGDDYLSDGGVFDNLGTSRIHLFLGKRKNELSGFVASDASAVLDRPRPPGLLRWNVVAATRRSLEILMSQVSALEIENWQLDAQASHPLHPIQIFRIVGDEEVAPYRPVREGVQKAVPDVKTDLDFFYTDTLRGLVLHGHGVAARSVALSTDPRRRPILPDQAWDPWPRGAQSQHDEVERLESAIRSDHKRRVLPWNPRWLGAHRK